VETAGGAEIFRGRRLVEIKTKNGKNRTGKKFRATKENISESTA
jgi:hypothetical protein